VRTVAKGKIRTAFAHTDMVLLGFFNLYFVRFTASAFVAPVAKDAALGFAATAH
jgi:hypothetical protein